VRLQTFVLAVRPNVPPVLGSIPERPSVTSSFQDRISPGKKKWKQGLVYRMARQAVREKRTLKVDFRIDLPLTDGSQDTYIRWTSSRRVTTVNCSSWLARHIMSPSQPSPRGATKRFSRNQTSPRSPAIGHRHDPDPGLAAPDPTGAWVARLPHQPSSPITRLRIGPGRNGMASRLSHPERH